MARPNGSSNERGFPDRRLALGGVVGPVAFVAAWVIGASATALAMAAVSTLAVAALPLGVSGLVDRLHAIAAGVGYVALASAPCAAARPLRQLGARALARVGVVVAVVAALSLTATLTTEATGAAQRIGLTMLDIWVVAISMLVATGRLSSFRGAVDRAD